MKGPSLSPRVAVTPVQRMSILPRKPIDCRKCLHCPSRPEVKRCGPNNSGHVFLLLLFTHLSPLNRRRRNERQDLLNLRRLIHVALGYTCCPVFAKNPDTIANPSKSFLAPGTVLYLRLAAFLFCTGYSSFPLCLSPPSSLHPHNKPIQETNVIS